ncbi:MAG: BolA protein [Zhongshania sp.]
MYNGCRLDILENDAVSVQDTIHSKIQSALQPSHLEVTNESYMHSVPPNSETHFKLVIVAEAFSTQRKVARQQKVYQLLAEELAGPVHALAMHTYSPDEWQQRAAAAPVSPDCLGGSKREQGAK